VIELLIGLVLVGVVLYLVETFIPMDPAIKTVIRVVVVLLLIVFLLRAFGITDMAVPRVR